MEQTNIQIEKLTANEYLLTFDPNEFDGGIDGHKWSLLIQSYGKKEKIDLEEVFHDPESDLYSASASTIEPLQKIVSIIKLLITDKNSMNLALEFIGNKFHDEDDMSIKEFWELKKEAGFDMSRPRKVTFLFSTLQDKTLAKKIERELLKNDYKTEIDTLDGDLIIEAETTMVADLYSLQEVEKNFRSMALKYGAIYIDCSF